MLASAQARAPSMVRLWDVCSGDCLSLFRTPTHTISALRWVQGPRDVGAALAMLTHVVPLFTACPTVGRCSVELARTAMAGR